jgi:hypothetical protein
MEYNSEFYSEFTGEGTPVPADSPSLLLSLKLLALQLRI